MSTHVVNEFHALPDRADDVMNLLIELSPISRTRPGCQAISLRRNQDTRRTSSAILAGPPVRITTAISPGEPTPATPAQFEEMLAQPMSIRYFDEVRAW
jgi:hypothetical protein